VEFVNEKSYVSGDGTSIQFIADPTLFKTSDEARAALAGWPLGEPDILNASAKKAPVDLLRLVEALSSLTVSEAAELSKMLRAKLNFPAQKDRVGSATPTASTS
jgi:hypothetical protein